MSKETCNGCDNAHMTYGESSLHYGLYCDSHEKFVDDGERCKLYINIVDNLREKIKELEEKLSIAVKALKFYGDEENYEYGNTIIDDDEKNDETREGYVRNIAGKRARETLEKIGEKR